MTKRLYTLILAIVLGACASTGDRAAPVSAAVNELPESGLGPQTLLSGECGLFLWSKTDPSKFIFFAKAGTGEALLSQGDDISTLTAMEQRGDLFGEFTTEIHYATQMGEAIRLTMTPGEYLTDGQKVSGGLITITDAEGWRTVLPILGVRACQSN